MKLIIDDCIRQKMREYCVFARYERGRIGSSLFVGEDRK